MWIFWPLALFFFSCEVYQVVAGGVDGELCGGGFVECALPPGVEVAQGVSESFCAEFVCSEVEDGDLLSFLAVEGLGAFAGDDVAAGGVHFDLHAHVHVVDEQADVAYCMVFAFACGSEDDDFSYALGVEVPYGF